MVKSLDGLGEGAIVADVGRLPATDLEADAGLLPGSERKKSKKFYNSDR